MARLLLLPTILLLLLFGCSHVPEPIGYDYSNQHKLQAIHHWNVLAKDISNKINNELIRSDFLDTAVFVKETCSTDEEPCEPNKTTEFNEGFHDLLITQLVNYGIPTSAVKDREAITINYKVQVVYSRTDRFKTPQVGILTALTAGVTVLRNAPKELIAIALAAGIDYAISAYSMKTNFEVIVTTSMVFNKKYLFRSSDIYYINDADYHHFQDNKKNQKTIQLTTSNPF